MPTDLSGVWRFDTSEVMAAPAPGYVRTDPAPVSRLALSATTWGGAVVLDDLLALGVGDTLLVQEVADATLAAKYALTAAPVDHATWVEFVIEPIATTATGPPRKNEDLLVLGRQVEEEGPPDWRPTPDDVAHLLRARTKDSDGEELGEWTEDTRPTLAEVEALIDQAHEMMGGRFGTEIANPCAEGARRICALLAAMLVELSYFPEQVRSERSAYQHYKDLYDQGATALEACIAGGGEDGIGPEVGVGYGYHSLPVVPETTARARAAAEGTAALAAWTAIGPWGDVDGDHWPEPENSENWRLVHQPPREPPLPEDLPVGDAPASGVE